MAGSVLDASLPVHLLLGSERLLINEAVEGLIKSAIGTPSGFNMATFQAADAPTAPLNAARTMPMMSRRKVVLVRGMEQASGELLAGLLEYLDSPSEVTLLVLTGSKLPPASGGTNLGVRLSNKVKKVGKETRFKAGGYKPIPFAVAQAKKMGCLLDGGAARLLVAMAGADLSLLQAEVSKLVCYVGGEGTIDTAAVEAVCSLVAEGKIWDLTDALVRRDTDKALAVAHRLLEEGQPSHKLLSTVTWKFRQLLELQDSMRRREDPPQSWARTPRRKLQAAQRLLSERPMHSAKVMAALRDANYAFNRSRAGERRVFESLILQLTEG